MTLPNDQEGFEIQNLSYNIRSQITHFKREIVKATHYGVH